jgi:hypothetical protein
VVCQHIFAGTPEDATEYENGHDGVVQGACHRYELGDEVNRGEEPDQSEQDEQLGTRGTLRSLERPRKSRIRLGRKAATSLAEARRPAKNKKDTNASHRPAVMARPTSSALIAEAHLERPSSCNCGSIGQPNDLRTFLLVRAGRLGSGLGE